MLSRTLDRFPLLRLMAATLLVGLILSIGLPLVLVAQDSTAVIPEITSHAPALALAMAAVSFVSFLVWQGIKWASQKADGLPSFGHKVAVFLIASALTAVGTVSGLPLPTTLEALSQDNVVQVITWLVTILFGGGGAMMTHAAKKATVG